MDGNNFSKCLLSVSRVLNFGISFPPFFFHYVKSSYLCIAYILSKYRSKISLCLMRLKSKQSLNTLNGCMRFFLLSLGLAIQLWWKFSKGLWKSISQEWPEHQGVPYIHFLFLHTMAVSLGWNNLFPSQSANCEFPSELH